MAGPSKRQGTVLVTGLAGFTGAHLKPVLESRGYTVIGIDQRVPEEWRGCTRICNLLDQKSVRDLVMETDPSAVLHLAGISSVTHSQVAEIYEVNILGTRNLLEALRELPSTPQSVILASTATVYGDAKGRVIDESFPPEPTSDYAVSKLAMEHLSRLFEDSLPITIVRPFNYTGRGQSDRFVVPKILNHYASRAPVLELGNIDVVRDIADVRRVVEAYVRLIDQPVPGEVLNICSENGISIRSVLDVCRDLTGHVPEIRINPALVRKKEVDSMVGSCRRLENSIGTLPVYSFRETLKWMLEERFT